MTPAQRIVQLLLFEGGPLFKSSLQIKPEGSDGLVMEVKKLISPLGLELIQTKDKLEIALSAELNQEISTQKLEDLKTELSESALQTLTIVLYKPGATKPEIDFVRGVDSVRSIKALVTRGLIERQQDKNRNTYYPTTETLKYLGLHNVENLPEYSDISAKLVTLLGN